MYASLIGALQWISGMTRFDTLFAVSKLSSFTANPTDQHVNATKRVVKYLNGTHNIGFRMGPVDGEEGILVGFFYYSNSYIKIHTWTRIQVLGRTC